MNSSLMKWYLVLSVVILITFALQVMAKHQILPIVNFYIPDSLAYEIRVLYEREVDTFSDALTGYNRVIYTLGTYGFFLTNSAMLFLAVYFAKALSCISEKAVNLARAIIVFNPYLLVGVISPHKETMLICLSLASFYFMFKPPLSLKIIGFFFAILTLYVRLPMGMILILSIFLRPFIPVFKNPIFLFLAILICYFALNAIPSVNAALTDKQGEELQYFGNSRILQLAIALKVMNEHPLLQFPAFAIKTALILITPVVRPNPFFSMPFPLLDAGYSIMAYLLLPINVSILLTFLKPRKTGLTNMNRDTQHLLIYVLLGILAAIVNPNISFRYIFPYTPAAAALFYGEPLAKRNQILKYTVGLIFILFIGTAFFFRKETEREPASFPRFTEWF